MSCILHSLHGCPIFKPETNAKVMLQALQLPRRLSPQRMIQVLQDLVHLLPEDVVGAGRLDGERAEEAPGEVAPQRLLQKLRLPQ